MGAVARAVTFGPRYHWFGYYDMPCWDKSGRYLLSLGVDFYDRPPTGDDLAVITLSDLETGAQTEIAQTRAFNWQQGAMLNWLHALDGDWFQHNDRRDGRFVSIMREAHTGAARVLGPAVSDVGLGNRLALGLNFARIAETRPGYGYAGLADPYERVDHPDGDGVTVIDLDSGSSQLVVSMRQVAELLGCDALRGCKMWFNHTLLNPGETRFAFLARWRRPGESGWQTAMLTANPDGSDLKLLLADGMVSHYDWQDDTHILAWTRIGEHGDHFYLIDDTTGEWRIVGADRLTADGHCSFARQSNWILTDTYPFEPDYQRSLKVYLPDQDREVILGSYASPPPYVGELRCDLHPRWRSDDRQICFDSVHEGSRQVYLVDVPNI